MQAKKPLERDALVVRLVRHLAEIAAGESTITEAMVTAEPDEGVREVLVGLLLLQEDLRYERDKLQRTERLAALGELAAVVAHEVRNPLAVLFNSLGSLRRIIPSDADAERLLTIMGEEAERLNHIVGDLLDFARPRTAEVLPEPLDRVLDDAIAAALTNRPDIRLIREVEPSLPLVRMDERLVRQALLNIALNALQSMPQGGELTVRAKRDVRPRGGMVRIEIADVGAGIQIDARAQMFEPFFTTKATGTGLGLALVKRIIDEHHGEVDVVSAVGQGTTFTLWLPLET